MGQILFETKEINTTMVVMFLLAITMFLCIFIGVSIILFCKHKMKRSTAVCVFSALVLLLIHSLYCLVQVPIQKKEIYDKYKNGEFFTEEGYVSIIYNDENVEEYYFIVNKTTFSLNDRQAYNFSYKYDELCVYDGQYIKVSYVKYRNKNLIMKIEEMSH